MNLKLITFIACGFILLNCLAALGQTTVPIPIEAKADVVQSAQAHVPAKILITLHNQSPSAELTNVVVKLEGISHAPLQTSAFGLKPGQVTLQTFDVQPTDDDLYAMISFEWNNQTHSLAIPVVRPISTASVWPTTLPVIGTLMGGVLGAWLVNYFTQRREQTRANFEWSKMLFEKYEGSFRVFLASWQDLSSTVALQTEFRNLVQNAYVPVSIRNGYSQTIAVLSDESKQIEQKNQAGKEFQELVERFLTNPSYS